MNISVRYDAAKGSILLCFHDKRTTAQSEWDTAADTAAVTCDFSRDTPN